MISLTERAAAKIRDLQAENAAPGQALRFFIEPGGCSGFEYGMSFADPQADDEIAESAGVRVLLDPVSLTYLRGCEIDFDDGLHGKGFEIRNPNATTTCGCGKSFG